MHNEVHGKRGGNLPCPDRPSPRGLTESRLLGRFGVKFRVAGYTLKWF